jgi:uncharacterized protein YcfJ
MIRLFTGAIALTALFWTSQADAQVVFYEHDNFDGRSFSADRPIENFTRSGFNDRASSIVVLAGRWEVCDTAQYRGRCVVLRTGRYPSLSAMSLNDRVSSARNLNARSRVPDDRYAPPAPMPVYDNRRRKNERVYEATVTSARAVYSNEERRCWMEREQVHDDRSSGNVGGALLGAVIGGILGHQVGSGRGQDAATVGGAVIGGAVGYNVGGDKDGRYRDVERCDDNDLRSDRRSARPDYWDVTYVYRGKEHRIQTTYDPGRTVTVNRKGEPRA